MGFLRLNKDNGKLALVFDIGSSSIGGALLLVRKSGIPKIITSFREPIIPQKVLDVDRFLPETIKSLQIVTDKIRKAGMGMPRTAFCVLSSPWHISQTRIIKYEKNSPFVFTSKLALNLIQKEINLFEEEYLTKYQDAQSPVKSIEFKNIKMMLNGYESSHPLDQKAKELEMAVFISIGGEQILQKIEETIKKNFYVEEVKFASFVLASFAVARDMYAHNEDFILIDIEGEVTDITMVKKNVLHDSISFPFGINFFVRGIASESQCPLGEAESLLSLYLSSHAADSVAKRLEPILVKLKKEWLNKFQTSLTSLSNDISVPSTIYLVVEKEMASFFAETIKNEQFNQYILTESKFKVTFQDSKTFHGLAIFKESEVVDPGLIIDCVYINRFLDNSIYLNYE